MLISTFVQIIRVRAKEAPVPMLERLMRESARQFFREARVWRTDFGGAISAGSDAYDLTLPTGALAHDIIYAKLKTTNTNLEYLRDAAKAYISPDDEVNVNSDPTFITLIDNNTFCLSPKPRYDDVIDMKIILTIPRTATEIDDQMVEEFEDALIDGCLFRLYEQPNETWSDMKLSQYHLQKYMAGIAKAKLRAEETRTPGVRVAAFSW